MFLVSLLLGFLQALQNFQLRGIPFDHEKRYTGDWGTHVDESHMGWGYGKKERIGQNSFFFKKVGWIQPCY